LCILTKQMNQQPLLSVIVPCYNVEQYVDKCISSIIGQTYANLEILLIDDGSSDHTGARCDAWQERDARIRVIHKQNEGPSYARRTGIENARADYITFVDSDDWIDTNMYTQMMSALLSTGSDIAQCGYCHVYEDGRMEALTPFPHQNREEKMKVFGRKEGVSFILESKYWQSFMWNKIFKRNLFEPIVFPADYYLEDFVIMPFLFHHASQSVYLNDAYYFYYQRTDSLMNELAIQKTLIRNMQWANANYNRYLFVKNHPQYQEMMQCVKRMALYRGLLFLRNVVDYPHFFPSDAFKQQSKLLRSIPFSYREIPCFFKPDFLILKILPRFYKPFYRFFYRHLTRIICRFKK